MNKKSYVLYMSLLPLAIILVLIFGAGYLLLKDEFNFSKILAKEPEVRRLEGFPAVLPGDPENTVTKQRRVIKNQQELEDFLRTVDPQGTLQIPTNIDFGKEYLLGVSTDTQDKGGSKVKIRKLYEDKEDKSLVVTVRHTVPGEACLVPQSFSLPVDLVAVSKNDYEISFEVEKYTIDRCEDLDD